MLVKGKNSRLMCEIRTEKEKQERQYCNICGSGLAEHGTERYNEVTGEEIKSKHCTNLNCERGCSSHVWIFLQGNGNLLSRRSHSF